MRKHLLIVFSTLVLLFSVLPAAAFAAPFPGPDDLQGCRTDVELPAPYSWLDSYEVQYVKTRYGKCAYLRFHPASDSGYYDYVYEQDAVTVLARQNGYSLVLTDTHQAGWVTSSVLADFYPGLPGDGWYSGFSASLSPGENDMTGSSPYVTHPDARCWLSDYETRYVKTRYGVRAYLRYSPDQDSGYFDYVYETDAVTVLARQNGFSLVRTGDGRIGWVTSGVLVTSYY